ncbi:hypothetical protein I4U23_011947 [Adineta vaga]|nr:hypothetical protein I4U23_011947 [Adineta vaga]
MEISIHDGHGRAYLRNTQIDISALADDILEWMKRNTQKIVESKSSHSLSSEPFIFIWYQFFFSLLSHLQRTETAKRELTDAIHRDVPDDNERNRGILEEFESNYTSENAILWYTKDTFIYRMINHRLRSGNIDAIFEYRILLLDIQKQLQNLQSRELDITASELVEVYRGQPMSIEENQYITANLGGIIAINPFLSTTREKELAELFSMDGFNDPERCFVLFTIRIPLNVRGAIYASIDDLSEFSEEKETLISWRSLFRVDSVERGKSGRYMIQLTLIDEDDPQYREQQKVWKTSLGDRSFFDGRSTQLFMRDLNEMNGPFLSFQVLMDIVLRLEQTEFAKEEMVEFCRIKYTASNIILGQIDIFKDTYKSNDAARWYTKDSFLYQLLNQTLRLEKIDLIFKFRLFIRDLHNQLHDLQDEFIRNESARNPRRLSIEVW